MFLGTKGIEQAIYSQTLYNDRPYIEEYRSEMVGKAPNNSAIAFPENERVKHATDLTSKVCYLSVSRLK